MSMNPDILAQLLTHIPRYGKLIALVSTGEQQELLAEFIIKHGLQNPNIWILNIPTDSDWIRDYGPVFVMENDRRVVIKGFDYEMSEGVDQRLYDNELAVRLALKLKVPHKRVLAKLEGGNLLTDGQGLLLTSMRTPTRNMDERGFEFYEIGSLILKEAHCTTWSPNDVLVGRYDPEHDPESAETLDKLAETLSQQASGGKRLKVWRIPMPRRRNGYWRSYTNVIMFNGLLVVPVFTNVAPGVQEEALALYRQLMPGWDIVTIDAERMAWRSGFLHCVSLNVPWYVDISPLREHVQVAASKKKALVSNP
jgi:agmatine deiminase